MTNPDPTTMEKLQHLVETYDNGWDRAWGAKTTPWDFGEVQPALRELVLSKKVDLPIKGRALVPGCGRGYDAIFLASALGLDSTAIDISPIAVAAANELKSQTSIPTGSVTFEERNFFAWKVTPEERFDLVYDYTFFVAIPPTMRNDWGRQMASLVKPGGFLLTLVFPIDPHTDKGPPHYVRPEHYLEPLGDGWEKVLDEIPAVSAPTHVDRERMVVWKRV